MLSTINRLLARLAQSIITVYQYTISPDKGIFSPILKGRICSHHPHCSAYGKECFERYGFRPGVAYTAQRVLACTPSMNRIYDPSHYKIVFFSGSPVGVSFLEGLSRDNRFDIVGVVTMPDKASGRGQHIHENAVAQAARDLHIPTILKPDYINPGAIKTEAQEQGAALAAQLEALGADYFVVVAYGKIFPQALLDIPSKGCINVHGSILPEYRGASPLQSVFLDNRKETGMTIQKMSLAMDEGDCIQTYKFQLPFERTSRELFTKVQADGPTMLADALWDFGKGDLIAQPQDHTHATYCKKISKEDGEVAPRTTPLHKLYAQYRAYAVWPKTWFIGPETFPHIAGKICIIDSLLLDEDQYNLLPDAPLVQGTTLHPAVLELTIKPEGKKSMDWKAFVNGYLL